MRRWILVVLSVAALSSLIAWAERARSAEQHVNAGGADWVRTVDGWEPRAALRIQQPTKPIELHPAIVAAFQMGASLLVLLAFPGRAVPLSSTAAAGRPHPHARRQRDSHLAAASASVRQ